MADALVTVKKEEQSPSPLPQRHPLVKMEPNDDDNVRLDSPSWTSAPVSGLTSSLYTDPWGLSDSEEQKPCIKTEPDTDMAEAALDITLANVPGEPRSGSPQLTRVSFRGQVEATTPTRSPGSTTSASPDMSPTSIPTATTSMPLVTYSLTIVGDEVVPLPAIANIDMSDNDSFEDGFVQFILHCNPSVPVGTTTDTLREKFRALPCSTRKVFFPLELYSLCKGQMEQDINSTDLVKKVGIYRPRHGRDDESEQKPLQYCTRVKKWMHNLHVDAYFAFLDGQSHCYFTDIPQEDNFPGTTARDGVLPRDDLAARALARAGHPNAGRKRSRADRLSAPLNRGLFEHNPVADDNSELPATQRSSGYGEDSMQNFGSEMLDSPQPPRQSQAGSFGNKRRRLNIVTGRRSVEAEIEKVDWEAKYMRLLDKMQETERRNDELKTRIALVMDVLTGGSVS